MDFHNCLLDLVEKTFFFPAWKKYLDAFSDSI